MSLRSIIKEYDGLLIDFAVCTVFAGVGASIGLAYAITEDRSTSFDRQSNCLTVPYNINSSGDTLCHSPSN